MGRLANGRERTGWREAGDGADGLAGGRAGLRLVRLARGQG